MLETLLQKGDTAERCGLILKDETIVEIENIAPNTAVGFEMNPVALIPFLDNDLIAATWHTHVDSSPNLSGEDHESFRSWPQLDHYVIGLLNGKPSVAKYQVQEGFVIQCD